ncbi:putative aquaporin PIP2-5, partial [Cucurbita argyrosperma subsp. sororia]
MQRSASSDCGVQATLLFLYVIVLTVIGYRLQFDSVCNMDVDPGGSSSSLFGLKLKLELLFLIFSHKRRFFFHFLGFQAYKFPRCVYDIILHVVLARNPQNRCKPFSAELGSLRPSTSTAAGRAHGPTDNYTLGIGLPPEIVGTFMLAYTTFSPTDPK